MYGAHTIECWQIEPIKTSSTARRTGSTDLAVLGREYSPSRCSVGTVCVLFSLEYNMGNVNPICLAIQSEVGYPTLPRTYLIYVLYCANVKCNVPTPQVLHTQARDSLVPLLHDPIHILFKTITRYRVSVIRAK